MKNSKNDISLDKVVSQVDHLTPEELLYLKEAMDNPELVNALWASDYEEIPVDIETFITDKRYLGSSFTDDEGKSLIYKFWRDELKNNIFNPEKPKWEVAFSGSIGSGKSSIADVCMAYILYKLLCLRDPAAYYKLAKGSRIALVFFNIGMDQAYGVGYSKFQSYLKASPWFLEHGKIYGRSGYETYYPGKDIRIIVASRSEHIIGTDVFCAFLDEIDYAKGSSMTDDQSKIMKLYATVKRRMESRYMRMGVIPGMLLLVSSKNSEDNFLEQYINANRDKPYLHIVDEPIWVVKADQGLYSGKKFLLAVGNKYRPSKILSDGESRESYENNGQRVIEVPIEHKEAFEQSMNQALMDIAGIAISSHSKYLSYNKIKLMYRDYLKNPFVQEVIELGFDDDSQLMDYLDEKKLSKLDRSKPHFVHWDASVTGDGTGLGMTTILSTKNVKRIVRDTGLVEDVNDIVHKIVFGVRIRAKEGEEIPFYKIRNFIYYLRDKLGYNIVMVSQDSFQSRDSLQTMHNNGFNTKLLSVDRTYDPYNSLKNAINEGRIISPHIGILEKELLDLEDDRKRNKVDHPNTTEGSKDVSDTIAACVYNATQMTSGEMESRKQAKVLAELTRELHDDFDNDEMDITQWK